jgi:16S rRNA (guanine966-N2)-methyltransferase
LVVKRSAAQARMLRIIGGQWRGRRWRFPDVAELRPTPDRVRETVFNWLSFRLAGTRCLDLFAGSGALGLEALSRGAAHVTFVERDTQAARAIQGLLADWLGSGQAERSDVVARDALEYLSRQPVRYDGVFLDPPFASRLTSNVLSKLPGWLAPGAWVYVEQPADAELDLPAGFSVRRSKRAGEVGYHLLAYEA